MKRAAFLVFPSRWYEAMPRTIIDAFAVGTPVVASNIGAMSDLVEDGKSGLFFKPGDPRDLATRVEWLFARPELMKQMRAFARAEYQLKFGADTNYGLLMDAYRLAVQRSV